MYRQSLVSKQHSKRCMKKEMYRPVFGVETAEQQAAWEYNGGIPRARINDSNAKNCSKTIEAYLATKALYTFEQGSITRRKHLYQEALTNEHWSQ